ncbi:MAG: GAP family protein [Candidatus Saccharibacteria bacterium]
MLGLLTPLAILGLLAIDPIGIAVMPILLSQKNPYGRSFAFLSGSFGALVLAGLLFAIGFGTKVLGIESAHAWLVPGSEIIAGALLLFLAARLLWLLEKGRLTTEPSDNLVQRLRLSIWHLLILGAILVVLQSMVDVVFVIAMIHIGQLHLAVASLLTAVSTYAIAALLLQLAIVGAYWVTPRKQKLQTLGKVHRLLARFANQAVIGTSLFLGSALLINGGLSLSGLSHL